MINTAGRFYLIVSTITIAIMYVIMIYLVPFLHRFLEKWDAFSGLSVLVSVLGALGLYRIIGWVVSYILKKWLWLRAKVFGPAFLHGTWIGYFRGHNNDLRYVIEHFEQDFDGLIIRGQSFDKHGRPHANWVSTSVCFDPYKGLLSYVSSCDIISRNVTDQSVCVFQISRDDQSNCAHGISGYAVDVNDGVRIAVTEKKLDKRLLSFSEALPQAREFARKMGE